MINYQSFNSEIPYNINIVKYKNFNFAPNMHRDFELVIVNRGKISATVDDKNYDISEGSFLLIMQNEVHSFKTNGESVVTVVVFSEDYVRDFTNLMTSRVVASHLVTPKKQEINNILKQINTYKGNSLLLSAGLMHAVALFYENTYEASSKNEAKKLKRSNLGGAIISFISKNYTQNIKLADMAIALGYEKHYLSRRINQLFGKSFSELVNSYRVYRANALMAENPSRTATDIAFESGFGSVRNFNRVYFSVAGHSPKNHIVKG